MVYRKVPLITLILFFCFLLNAKIPTTDFSAIEKGFYAPPESVQTACYWHWLNDHVSEEGVIKDLQAMKRAGINRAFLATNIRNRTSWSRDLTGQYFGKVKFMSEEWWSALHTALKTASDLNIEMGIFNCPGWSQSGGPWVKPEQAMRYLESSELRVKGPLNLSRQLEKPDTFFQDVKVLAIPVTPEYEQNLLDLPGTKISSSNLRILTPSSQGQAKYILSENNGILDIELPEISTVRSLTFYPGENMDMNIELQIKVNAEYKSIQSFIVSRSRTVENLAAGFEPYAPYFLSLDELKAKSLRLIFNNQGDTENQISNIVLSPTPVLKDLPEKKLAKVSGGGISVSMLRGQAEYSKDTKVPQAEQVLDISQYMTADGTLNWNVPKGDWIIMRTGMRFIDVKNGPTSFDAEGLEIDKINKKHIENHFDSFIGEILKRIPAQDRKTLKVVVLDSYERGGQNFTDGFLADFKNRYGYDATPYLPVYKGHIIGNPDLSNRFLWDIRRLVADKISYDYVGGLTETSHKHGLTTWLENYGHSGFAGESLQYGGQADEVSGEFWYEPISSKRFENRIASSAAHTYEKNKVWSESFPSGSWVENYAFSCYPQKLKRVGDWAFTEGVNSTLLHVYIHQPYENEYPGIDAWYGTEFNRKNTWFNQVDLFTLYHKRCNFMLQQGLNVADVAYFFGEDTPKMTGACKPELPRGYNFDFINAEVILRDMSVKNGRLVLPHGTSYSILVLPPQKTMRPEVLAKIEQLVLNGAIVLGPPPSQSPSLQDYPNADKKVQELAKKMWGDLSVKQYRYGKGMVLNDMSLEDAFKLIKVTPDCLSDNNSIRYTHRTVAGKDIYFLTNISDKAVDFTTAFRVNGLQPELWNALTGTVKPLPAFKQIAEVTKVPLRLAVDGSAFIVFQSKGQSNSNDINVNFPTQKVVAAVSTPWKVSFEHDSIKRGPSEPVIFKELTDWTKSNDDHIRYYSGTAVYSTILAVNEIPENQKLYLDLGDLSALAKIKVNGVYVGGVWTSPYQVNVTGKIKKGKNNIEIELVNTWLNRLIGDSRLPENERLVKSKFNKLNATSTLQKSGLFGPVNLLTEK